MKFLPQCQGGFGGIFRANASKFIGKHHFYDVVVRRGRSNSSGTIVDSYSTGDVSGKGSVGGLVGSNSSGTIVDSYATGTVSGTGNNVGGLVGQNVSGTSIGTIDNSYSTGAVSGKSYVGGLAGENSGSGCTISNSYSTGEVSGTDNYVGGLVGYNLGKIDNSYSMGAASGTSSVGGLVGYNSYGGTIDNSYSVGEVSGTSNIGGLAGWNSGTINNNYSTGEVSGTSNVGGLVGYNLSLGKIINSYYNKETSGQDDENKGDGKTTAQMKQVDIFEEDWDFDNIWRIAPDINSGYPYLLWAKEYIVKKQQECENEGKVWENGKCSEETSQSYTITFNSDGGSAITGQKITEGDLATKPTDPTKEGFTFSGWFNELLDRLWDFLTDVVTSNTTLTAVWEAISSSSTELSSSSTEQSSSSIEPSSSSSSVDTDDNSSSSSNITDTSSSSSDGGITPIRLPQIATGNVRAFATANTIVLENLPSNAEVEVFDLHGRGVLHTPGTSQIPVQAKGIYIVKTGTQTFRIAVK